MSKDKLIERVRKLMAMADDASSPNEAAIAAQRARALMDKHQIDYDDIQFGANDFTVDYAGKPRSRVPLWEQWLSVKIAKLNDCQTGWNWDYENGGYSTGKTHSFKGFTTDVEVCKYMLHYMVNAAKRQAKAYFKGRGLDYSARIDTQFKQGFTNAVMRKMDEMIEERKKIKASSGKDLVVLKCAMVESHFGAVKYGSARSVGAHDPDAADALRAGVMAGQQQSIHVGVESTHGQAAIGFAG